MPLPIVGVMGPGEGATPQDCELAYELGAQIAQQGWVLLTGGRAAGVMAAASQGAAEAGGLTVGILPTGDRTEMSPHVQIPIVTGMGSGRNVINILTAQAIVACGMGLGTASEVALALKAQTPVVLLNADEVSWEFFRWMGDRQSRESYLYRVKTVQGAIAILQQWT
ncbi:MAG: TIGR00725 family protein [Synechococcales bacterium]|nr:TIGR00725 family protein [Synechococcales bacterium]